MLQTSFNICIKDCCKAFSIYDTTYLYSSDNLTGWGFPNAVRTDVVEANLVVTTPSLDLYVIDITSEVIADTEIIVSPIDLGMGEEVESGLYIFTFSVNTGTIEEPVWITYETNKLIYCLEEKKIRNLFGTAKLSKGCCSECDKKNIEDLLNLWTYLEVLKNAACCGKVEKFKEILAIINQLLNSKPCTNC
jgi:hypothetical protein